MSTVTLRKPSSQPRASSAQSHRKQLNINNNRSSSNPYPSRQQEKDAVIANYEVAVGREVLPAEQIAKDKEISKLGCSSHSLRVEDFELMKTLGTGELVVEELRRRAYRRHSLILAQGHLLVSGLLDLQIPNTKTATRSSP